MKSELKFRFRSLMKKKLDNKGLSLVELVIAIAMSSIVLGASAMFLYNANKSYHAAEFSIDVQMEAQILMEQMGNWVMESNKIYVSPSGDVLVLYSIPRNNDKNLSEIYPESFSSYSADDNKATRRIIFSEGSRLYMIVQDGISDAEGQFKALVNPPPTGAEELYTEDDVDEANCICEFLANAPGISAFKVEIASKNASGEIDRSKATSISVSLTLKEGAQRFPESYTVKNTFSIRNGLYEVPTTPSDSPEEGEEVEGEEI